MCGDCNTHLGCIVYDCMCLMLGATDMREKMSNADARVLAAAAEPALMSIKQQVLTIADKESDRFEIASAAFQIVSSIYSSGCLAEVYKIWAASLPTKYAIKYTAKGFKTLLAAFFTDGASTLGVIMVELATFPQLIEDSIDCKACCYA